MDTTGTTRWTRPGYPTLEARCNGCGTLYLAKDLRRDETAVGAHHLYCATCREERDPRTWPMEVECCVCHEHIRTIAATYDHGGLKSHGLCRRPECRQAMTLHMLCD